MFYVYLYLDPRKSGNFQYKDHLFDFEPFYVGKGSGKRLNEHLKRTDHSPITCKIRKLQSLGLEPTIITYRLFVKESPAFLFEKELISVIGRKDLNRGPLCNLTDGGEGSVGYVFTPEQKKLQSERMIKWAKENPITPETREKLSRSCKGLKKSKEHVAKIVKSRKGFQHTEETKDKLSILAKNREIIYKTCHCGITIDVGNYAKYHGDNCGKTGLWPISKEQKIKIGNANRGRILPKIECLYCHKFADGGNYARWHGNNCKAKHD